MSKRIFLLFSFLVTLILCNYLVLAKDLNNDGKVDIRDIVIVVKAFKSKPGDLNWNPDADLNNDGIISILDINIVANNLSTGATPESEPTGLSTTFPLSIFSDFVSWFSSLIGITTEEPSPTTKVYLDPIEIIDSRLTDGETFKVDLNLYDVANLVGWEVKIGYNPEVLNFADVVFSDFLGNPENPEEVFSYFSEDANAGIVGILAVRLPDTESSTWETAYGSGRLATITFQVLLNEIESDLDLYDVLLVDPDALEIESEAVDGYFNNYPDMDIQYSKMLPSSGTIVH